MFFFVNLTPFSSEKDIIRIFRFILAAKNDIRLFSIVSKDMVLNLLMALS